MKKILCMALMSIAVYSHATTEYVVRNDEHRNAFFMQVNVGAGMSSFTKEKSGYSLDFTGYGADLDLKLGLSIRDLWAIHADFGFADYNGDWNYDHSGVALKSNVENDFYHVYLGLGGTFYPFRGRDNMLNGLFFGLGVEMSFLNSEADDGSDARFVDNDLSLFSTKDELYVFMKDYAVSCKLEVGETWRLGRSRWFIGGVLSAGADFIYKTKYEDDPDYDYTSFTVGMAFVVMRR